MQTSHHSVHYAPASVGGLMDTEFLREAVHHEESGGHRDGAPAAQGLSSRCMAALRRAWRGVPSDAAEPTEARAGRKSGE